MRRGRTPLPAGAPRRGRPRSQAARAAVLAAARELFERGGYAAATIEEIAARSGVAKTTIYRHWPHRPALLVELLLQLAAEVAPPPAGRDPREALRTELHMVARALDALPGRLLTALMSEMQCNPEVSEALVKGLFDPRRKATARVIHQAQLEGQLDRDVPPLVAVDLLFGPLFYRRLIRQEPVTPVFLRQLFEHALAGLAPRPGGVVPGGRRASASARRRPTG